MPIQNLGVRDPNLPRIDVYMYASKTLGRFGSLHLLPYLASFHLFNLSYRQNSFRERNFSRAFSGSNPLNFHIAFEPVFA